MQRVTVLTDFRRYKLIGQWFGELKLLAVSYGKVRTIPNVICRVVCKRGHESIRIWRNLRDSHHRRGCRGCVRTYPVTSFSNNSLASQIEGLERDRRLLFDVLLSSRRRAPGQEDTRDRELLQDTLAYVKHIADPVSELEEWLGEAGMRCAPTASSSLSSPSFMYVGVE